MKNFSKILWEIPQKVLAFSMLFYWYVNRKIAGHEQYKDATIYWVTSETFPGISLSTTIFINSRMRNDPYVVDHEYGHTLQSKKLGPLYLILVGIPSAARNIYVRNSKKNPFELNYWYYSGYPENWADRLGGVERGSN